MVWDETTQIDYPFLQNDCLDMFGDPRDPGFEREYLVVVDLGEFRSHFGDVKNYLGNTWGFRMYTNYVMEEPLKMSFEKIVRQGLTNQLHTFDGCFNIRVMKGGRQLSVHSWALAIDINARTNPFRRDGRLVTDLSEEFVACFTQSGFEWGGLWISIKDAMHFQLPWTKMWGYGEAGMITPTPFIRQSVTSEPEDLALTGDEELVP
jgi:uncharacterized protein (DUF3820 family)